MHRHARIHLVNFSDNGNDTHSPPSNAQLEAKYPGITSSLTRGDIIEDISISGYRSEGVWFWDGASVIEQDTSDDPYGMVPSVFKIGEFPPGYWDDLIDTKPFSVCWEKGESAFYWHINPAPVEFDASDYCPISVNNDNIIIVRVLGTDYSLVINSTYVSNFNNEQTAHGGIRICWNADDRQLEYGFPM